MQDDSLTQLRDAGWLPPSRARDGVRYMADCDNSQISYPEAALDSLGLDGGSGFWFDHRAHEVARVIEEHAVTWMLDVGAGTGSMGSRLQPLLSGGYVAIEPLQRGAQSCASLGLTSLCGTFQDLRLPDASVGCVGTFDVLEHLGDPGVLLRDIRRALRPGGLFIVTVPAFQWLWGDEDVAAGHMRRYTSASLAALFHESGFAPKSIEYLFASLVPVAAVTRAIPYRLGRRRTTERTLEDLEAKLRLNPQLDRLGAAVLCAESLLARKVRLPFGLSLLGVFSPLQ